MLLHLEDALYQAAQLRASWLPRSADRLSLVSQGICDGSSQRGLAGPFPTLKRDERRTALRSRHLVFAGHYADVTVRFLAETARGQVVTLRQHMLQPAHVGVLRIEVNSVLDVHYLADSLLRLF